MITTINNEQKKLNFSSEREQSQACLNSAEHEKNQERKVLNVPNLRFKEFQGEWEKKTIGEISTIKNGPFGSVLHAEDYVDEGMPIVTTEHFKNGNLPLSKNGIPQVSDDDYHRLRGYKLEKDDIVFSRVGSIDINAYVEQSQQGWLFSGRVLRVRPIKSVNSLCLHYILSTESVKRSIRNRAVGQTMPSINTPILSNTKINIPQSVVEQKKIANLLSLLDERITTQNKIIEDLKKLKSAIIDYAINSLNSDFAKFDSLYEMAGEGGTPTTSNASFYDNGKIPFIKIDDLKQKYLTENKDFITELGLQKSSAWLVPTRSILFSNGATIGEITITTYPVCTKQGILGIVPKQNIDVEFLYYFMSSSYFKKAISRIVTEGTMKTAYLKDINNILCPIPTKEKQQEIAKMPSTLNSKIDFEQSILKLFCSQKQYLLRQMFI